MGIDLATNSGAASIQTSPDGVTPNDGALFSTAPNLAMDKPVISRADLVGNALTVSGYVGSAPGQSNFANGRVEFFKSSTSMGAGQGQLYLGNLTTDSFGNFTGAVDVTGLGLTASDSITSSFTLSNATSEFSVVRGANVAPSPILTYDPQMKIHRSPLIFGRVLPMQMRTFSR